MMKKKEVISFRFVREFVNVVTRADESIEING